MEIHWNLDISLVKSITLEYHCESRVKNLWSLASTILRKIFSSVNIFIMKLSCKFFFTNRLRSSIFFIFFFNKVSYSGGGSSWGGSLPLPAGFSSASSAFNIDISISILPWIVWYTWAHFDTLRILVTK